MFFLIEKKKLFNVANLNENKNRVIVNNIDGNNGALTMRRHKKKNGIAILISFSLNSSFLTKKANIVKTNKTNG